MSRKRIGLVIVFGAALVAALVAGSVHWTRAHASAAPAKFIPAPEGTENLSTLEAYWNNRITYPTGRFNPAWLRAAARQASHSGGTTWTALGPQPERMDGCTGCYNYHKTEGRLNSIAVDPSTTTNGSITAYAGSVGGGVWKTTDCCSTSTTWQVLTDDPLINSTAIDSVTLDPSDPQTIYAGTGDLNYGSFSMGSQGILKSTDGGATWTVLGASVFGPAYTEPAGQFPQYDAVGKVRVDPNNSDNVVAGTKKGIFVSYDAGANWTGPCDLTGTGDRQDVTGLELSDMGAGVTRIIAAVGVRGFATTVQYDLGNNGSNGLYASTLPVSGCPTFASIASNANGFVYGTSISGDPYATGANMNAGSGVDYSGASTGDQLGRVDIAVAPSDPNVIYAQVQAIAGIPGGCGGGPGCQLGIWQTNDGGATWNYMQGSQGQALDNDACGFDYPQNWYDQGLAVDPNNPDNLLVDTYDVWRATRTGTTLTDLTCGYNGAGPHPVHVDQHALAYVPGSSDILLVGSDGGAFATPRTTSSTWTTG